MASNGEPKMKWKKINVSSIFGRNNKEPIVEIDISQFPKDRPLQLHTEEARALALNLLECAEAAEQDAFIYNFFSAGIGVDERQAANALLAYRDYRNKMRGTDG